MKNYNLNKKFQILFPFLFIIGIVLIVMGFNNKKIVNLSYKEKNAINYNVYLKENSFFESPFLPEGRTYIASLIDYIDINFHYDTEYDRKLNGQYSYKYIAIVRANKKEGSGYYWEKKYDLTELKTVDIKNNVNVSIDDNIKVKYSTYNEILNDFKKEYKLETNGELIIVMQIYNNSKFDKIDEPIEISSEMNLTIPLLEQAIEVGINKDTSNANDIISLKEKSNRPAYLIFKITGFILLVVSTLGFVDVTKTNILFKKKNLYEIQIDNILKSYDSIIANINKMPDINDFKKIEVSSFEELIDVYNEVRMPINYYHEKGKSVFIIINDSIVWIYTFKKDNSMKWVDNNEKESDKRKNK